MEKRIEEIVRDIEGLERKFRKEKDKLDEQYISIKAKCTHPEIGETGMFICPDCGYNGGPEYPEQLSEWDYENYNKNIEKTRMWRRALATKFTRDEIKNMTKDIKTKIGALKDNLKLKMHPLVIEWKEIQSNCKHINRTEFICPDCG